MKMGDNFTQKPTRKVTLPYGSFLRYFYIGDVRLVAYKLGIVGHNLDIDEFALNEEEISDILKQLGKEGILPIPGLGNEGIERALKESGYVFKEVKDIKKETEDIKKVAEENKKLVEEITQILEERRIREMNRALKETIENLKKLR